MALTLITHVFYIQSHEWNSKTKKKTAQQSDVQHNTMWTDTYSKTHILLPLSHIPTRKHNSCFTAYTNKMLATHIRCYRYVNILDCRHTDSSVYVCVEHLCTQLVYSRFCLSVICTVILQLLVHCSSTCVSTSLLSVSLCVSVLCVSVLCVSECVDRSQLWWALILSCSVYSLWQACCYSGNTLVSIYSL